MMDKPQYVTITTDEKISFDDCDRIGPKKYYYCLELKLDDVIIDNVVDVTFSSQINGEIVYMTLDRANGDAKESYDWKLTRKQIEFKEQPIEL